jgi:hypothetical protein
MHESSTYTYPLRLPKSLKDKVALKAKKDRTSLNQFIVIAVAEKMSALDTEDFFSELAQKADMKAFRAILFRSKGEPPRADDELE